ncbi:MAG: hypothetical protein V5A66_01665 [Candidatus Thermoplasmatota archaeon]|nr:hypothetical protein [Candidatus Thermoplasmatota archaeon]MBS3789294.1 hypothetical protein [Candidatus Thermoplasmatota archaeon]
MDKKIHKKIDKNDESLTIDDIQKMIKKIQEENPDREVFFDGDEYAICSRKKEG